MDAYRVSPVPIFAPRRRRKWLRNTLISILALIILACPAIAGYVGWSLTHPERKPITDRPESVQLAYQDVAFKSRLDQTSLRGWLIPADEKKERIVIFAHGYTNNRSGEKAALPTAKALHDLGIASLLFDFRDSGESDGKLTSVGLFEKDDLLAAIDYAKNLGYQKIGLIGYSMGASTALDALPEAPDVKAVVADSPFADLRLYLEDNLPVWSHLPAFPFTPLILSEIPLITGLDPDLVSPLKAVTQLHDQYVFLIHAEGDHSIPPTNSQKLKEASSSPNTTLWIGPGTKHVGTYSAVPDEYLKRVTTFFVEHLK